MTKRSVTQGERRMVRCAIYTRKSTEEGLEQAFNSLDAQREACEAYILSQRHEGWMLVRDPYDDGGFSGGNMDRPGLKRLLDDVRAHKVDVIVVYKVDRLTRSLADFAKIVEVLDDRSASFVSVTQAFNTTTSMGRLTLNVLLSFAQFEREVTGERIRDKIAASKAKGMWMGGPVPLGYRVESRKLVVCQDEARTVRHIFERYRALGSGRALIEELRSDGYRTRVRPRSGGGPDIGGVPFSRGMLFSMLSNRIYIGEIVHKGIAYAGEHDAIIPQQIWEQVESIIAERRINRAHGKNSRAPSLLAGLLRDGHARRMSPSHAVKSGKRYRYYVTHAADIAESNTSAWRIPASDIEAAVVQRLTEMLSDRKLISRLSQGDAREIDAGLKQAASSARRLDTPYGRSSLVGALVRCVTIEEEQVIIEVDRPALQRILGFEASDGVSLMLSIPAVRVRRGKDVKLVIADQDGAARMPDDKLMQLLLEARTMRDAVLAAPELSIKVIARGMGKCSTRATRLLRIGWLAPEIIEAIVEGRHPSGLTPAKLLAADLPVSWHAQKAILGFA